MNTPDDLHMHEPEANDEPLAHTETETPSREPGESEAIPKEKDNTLVPRHSWRAGLRRFAVHLQSAYSMAEKQIEPQPLVQAEQPAEAHDSRSSLPPARRRVYNRRPGSDRRGDHLRDWQSWPKFRLWRHTRPFWVRSA